MMSKLSLKIKLAIGFGVLLLILTAISVTSCFSMHRLSELSAFTDKKARGQFYAASIDSLINSQKAEYRAFLLTNQEQELSRYAENNRILAEDFEKLEATLSAGNASELAVHLRQTLDTYHGIIDRVVELHRAGKQKQAIDLVTAPKSDAVRADLGKTVAELVELQDKLKTAARAEQAATESRAITLVLSLAILGAVLGLVDAALIARSVTGGILGMVNLIQEIAANNLAIADMEIASQDEIGKAGAALNRMKNNL